VAKASQALADDLAKLALAVEPASGGYLLDLPGESVIPEVAGIVARHEAGLLSLSPVTDSLEDVFHKLMKGDAP
jgi:hypothetical protein